MEFQNVLVNVGGLRNEADADFLVEHFQDLSARAALDQFAVELQTLNRFTTADGNPQVQYLVLSRVILTRLCLRDDNMFDLRPCQRGRVCGKERSTHLVHQNIRSGVQSSSHRFIQDIFKPLLLSHDPVEEIRSIDMGWLDSIQMKARFSNKVFAPAPCQSKLEPLTGSYLLCAPARKIAPGGRHVLQIPGVRQV